MTKVIGINGFKRAGKGETAAAIASLGSSLVPGFTTLEAGFADKLKILAAKTLGFIDRSDQDCIDLMNEAKESWLIEVFPDQINLSRRPLGQPWHELTGREYLQNLGNEARGVFGDDFWVDQVLPVESDDMVFVLSALYPGVNVLAISDLRYENEAQRVLDCGGEVWEVIRPGTESDGHASEQVLPRRLVTRQINNSGDLMALRYEVEKALGLGC